MPRSYVKISKRTSMILNVYAFASLPGKGGFTRYNLYAVGINLVLHMCVAR